MTKLGTLVSTSLLMAAPLASGATLRVPQEHGSIQDAIDAASAGDEVLVAPGTYDVTSPIVFRGKGISVKSVQGPLTTVVRMTAPENPARGSVFAFEDAEPEQAVLEGFTITGGTGIVVQREVIAFQPPLTIKTGGGVYCGPHAAPLIKGSIFKGNSAEYGGAIVCDVDAQPRLVGNEIEDNYVARSEDRARGGGIACFADSVVALEGGVFARNRADDGGAVYLADGSSLEINGVRFEENVAGDDGGAVLSRGERLEIKGSTFLRNQAHDQGGAVGMKAFGDSVTFLATDAQFEANAAYWGGALYMDVETAVPLPPSLLVERCRFLSNHADSSGGGAYVGYDCDKVTFKECRFEENRADFGGGLYCEYDGVMDVVDSSIRGNTAVRGGGAFVEDGLTSFVNAVFTANVAHDVGGGIWGDVNLSMTHCTLAGNAAGLGGGVYSFRHWPSIESCVIWGNAGQALAGLRHPSTWFIRRSCVEGPLIPGDGNINTDPRLGAWGPQSEVYVDASNQEQGDGSRDNPYRDLRAAFAGYDLALAPDSPCIGSGETGSNMGADTGVAEQAGETDRLVHVGSGTYQLSGVNFAPHVSLEGAGERETTLVGSVRGVRTGAVLSRVTISGATSGGVLVSAGEAPEILHCVIRDNWGDRGGGVKCWEGSTPLIRRTTISGNASLEGGGIFAQGASLTIASTIVWDNAGGSMVASGGDLTVSHSCVEADSVLPGEGNTNGNPLFAAWGGASEVYVDAANPEPGDGTENSPYHNLADALTEYSLALQSNSPCVNAGEGGVNMGAESGVVAPGGEATRLIHVGSGNYPLTGLNLAHHASIRGAGEDETVLEGSLLGLRTGRFLSDATVTGGERGGIVVSGGEGPEIRSSSITGNGVFGVRNTAMTLNGTGPGCQHFVDPDCELFRLGGGVYCGKGSFPRFSGSRVTGNFAEFGGGVYAAETSTPELVGSTVSGNWADWGGGGLAIAGAASLVNCLIAGNRSWDGSALLSQGPSAPHLVNCTIAGVSAPWQIPAISCWGASPRIVNSIVWRNLRDPACTDATNSLVDVNPMFVREGNFDIFRLALRSVGGRQRLMPDFVLDAGDYRLLPGSPAIDAGTPDGAPETDIDGVGRPCGTGVDIGAYEMCLSEIPFRRGDVNADGTVDLSDAIFALSYLFLGGDAPDCLETADANDGGGIDLSDAVYLLNFLFLNGPDPRPPFPACGLDVTPARLHCLAYAPCE